MERLRRLHVMLTGVPLETKPPVILITRWFADTSKSSLQH